jgi:hypothetical protein
MGAEAKRRGLRHMLSTSASSTPLAPLSHKSIELVFWKPGELKSMPAITASKLEIRGQRRGRRSAASVCIQIRELEIQGQRRFGRHAVG